MIIYLGGKISSRDWRHMLVRGLEDAINGLDLSKGWPILEDSIHGVHGYSGPYFKLIDKTAEGQKTVKVHNLCLAAIDASDLVYSWVDDPTCYATIYEMGYARAKGKFTAVAYPPSFDKSELWFMSCCSDLIVEADRPEFGLLKAVLSAVRTGRLGSPAAELSRVEGNIARLQAMGRETSPITTEKTNGHDTGGNDPTPPEDAPAR